MPLVPLLLRAPGRAAAVVRVAAGGVMLARPATVGQVLGAAGPGEAWPVRMLGGREVALGLAVLASRRPAPLLAGALSDAVDAVVLSRALRSRRLGTTAPSRGVATACTAGAVAACAVQVVDAIRANRTPAPAPGATSPVRD